MERDPPLSENSGCIFHKAWRINTEQNESEPSEGSDRSFTVTPQQHTTRHLPSQENGMEDEMARDRNLPVLSASGMGKLNTSV